MKRQSGFSLVELVIVIVVLGLLAVAALPRFLDVTDQAKQASIEGVAGGYATAVLSARAQWEAEVRPNLDATNTNYVNYDGDYFWLTSATNDGFRDGYPIAYVGEDVPTGSSPTSITNNATCRDLMDFMLQNPPKVGVPTEVEADSTYKYRADRIDANVCRYTQLEGSTDSGHYFEYDVTKGSVTVTLED
ncbi:prepilin-type N-terminal cleavage/methylation domain-containing protein [Vibrio ulleungensis]|uniref:Prepilin-type N-terminal cleavage/methylation domain-containing protein n=1 Tax=Vibrio ulleungensis TaxID=2807619 RepID=A0ABS2HLX7_9VIBR|nr:prepilin-type N-terminal cleavage/methylation domain-containing protein [Vibrio ulleungensis]MBM7038029.1 prepilin-type N-terminal cleavage/methylation domain-containing protein [Vibrio ulleungensis]